MAEESDRTATESTEAARERHVARFKSLLSEYRARVDWSVGQLQDERLRALRELLSVAVQRSPWHRKRLADVDIDHFSDGDLGRLPVMTKSDLMDNFDDILTDRRLSRTLCEHHLDGLAGGAYLLGEHHAVASVG